jgi:hypothetical protein
MGVKFWLQNLHAQFTEPSVPVIFSSMVVAQKALHRNRTGAGSILANGPKVAYFAPAPG